MNAAPPEGNRNAWKHGGQAAETLAMARRLRENASFLRDKKAGLNSEKLGSAQLPVLNLTELIDLGELVFPICS